MCGELDGRLTGLATAAGRRHDPVPVLTVVAADFSRIEGTHKGETCRGDGLAGDEDGKTRGYGVTNPAEIISSPALTRRAGSWGVRWKTASD